MYRRTGFISIFGIFFFFTIMRFVFGLFGDLLYFGFAFLPIIAIIAIIALIIKSFIKSNKTRKVQKEEKVQAKKEANIEKINNKLTQYFKKYKELPIVDGLSFVTEDGYKDLDDLTILLHGEKTLKINEFKEDNNDGYECLIQLLAAFADSNEEVLNNEVKNETTPKENPLGNGDKYLNRISSVKNNLMNEEVKNALNLTCDLLKQIETTKNSKRDEEKLTKLYDYYLPILMDILTKYVDLQNNTVKSDEFKKSEQQLIKTTTLINEAMKSLLQYIQEDDYMNINADMDTLQSLLKKDGYVDNPFEGENNDR